MKKSIALLAVSAALLLVAPEALAQDAVADPNAYKGMVGLAAGITMGLAVLGGALGQGMAARAALEGIARNPQASGNITVPMFAGLAFIESLVIFALIIGYSLQGYVGA